MTTCYSHRLRPVADRVLTVHQEQLLQAGKKLEGDQQTRVFENQPRGYNGAALSPYRTSKKQTNGRKVEVTKKHTRWVELNRNGDGYLGEGGGKAKGLTPWKDGYQAWHGWNVAGEDWSREMKAGADAPAMQRATEATDEDGCISHGDWVIGEYSHTQLASRLSWELSHHGGMAYDPRTEEPTVKRVPGFVFQTTKAREAAVAEQVLTFGKTMRARHSKQTKAWEKKQESWKQLTHVGRGSQGWVSLDDRPEGMEGEEAAWTPISGDRMAELMAAEEKQAWKRMLQEVMGNLTDKQREAVELTVMGTTLNSSQRDNLQLARAKATRVAQSRKG